MCMEGPASINLVLEDVSWYRMWAMGREWEDWGGKGENQSGVWVYWEAGSGQILVESAPLVCFPPCLALKCHLVSILTCAIQRTEANSVVLLCRLNSTVLARTWYFSLLFLQPPCYQFFTNCWFFTIVWLLLRDLRGSPFFCKGFFPKTTKLNLLEMGLGWLEWLEV